VKRPQKAAKGPQKGQEKGSKRSAKGRKMAVKGLERAAKGPRKGPERAQKGPRKGQECNWDKKGFFIVDTKCFELEKCEGMETVAKLIACKLFRIDYEDKASVQ